MVPMFVGFQIHRTELPLPQGIIDPRQEPSLLFLLAYLKPYLDENNSSIDYMFFKFRTKVQKFFVLRVVPDPDS